MVVRTKCHHFANAFGVGVGHGDSDNAAITPTKNIRLVQFQCIEQGDHILCHQGIGDFGVAVRGLALTSAVHCNDLVILCKCRDLSTHTCNGTAVPVEHQEWRSLAINFEIDPDAIEFDKLPIGLIGTIGNRCGGFCHRATRRSGMRLNRCSGITGCGAGCDQNEKESNNRTDKVIVLECAVGTPERS